jgi:transposase
MLTQEEHVEIHALNRRGWSISEIARHTGRDRKTIRAYLAGDQQPGVRVSSEPDPFDQVEPYVAQRLVDDHGVWATTLFDEVQRLGYDRSYPTFTRKIRQRGLRPHCEACSGVKGRATVIIEHPAGEEIQWDWDELGTCPWDPSNDVSLLVGALSHSSKTRGWLSYSEDQPHLVEGIDEVLRRLGGTPRAWRVDRMATVINPTTGRLQTSFAPVAKHYGVTVVPCPPRRPNRKGVVEKQIDFLSQRWWRTLDATSLAEAQASLDRFCATISDQRRRGDTTVGELGAAEPLLDLPLVPYPAEATTARIVAQNALVSVDGNRYSVPPALVGAEVTVRQRLGSDVLIIVSAAGSIVATHRAAPRGVGRLVRLPEHTRALEKVVLAAFTTDRPCPKKPNRPPTAAALAIGNEITGDNSGAAPVIDLATYQRFIDNQGGVS